MSIEGEDWKFGGERKKNWILRSYTKIAYKRSLDFGFICFRLFALAELVWRKNRCLIITARCSHKVYECHEPDRFDFSLSQSNPNHEYRAGANTGVRKQEIHEKG
ncbi:hypothetical protein H5410_048574 [Solanum commersonii]|uniref:Uncharacterized protein n=1 Tax=Solanum commersonii TaxID=4109 RepID=A0A9J5XLH5_SOLCO|nr:hypothetical protein H5410_048574 [Solanum commersonii]